jgi:hypothetical protein
MLARKEAKDNGELCKLMSLFMSITMENLQILRQILLKKKKLAQRA